MRSASPIAIPYPARWTRAIISSKPVADGLNLTTARSDDKFTTALCTPLTFFKLRSMVETQLAQYMPVMGKVNCFVSGIIYQAMGAQYIALPLKLQFSYAATG